MRDRPWDSWAPGVLNKGQIRELADHDFIRNMSANAGDLDYSAFDLRISKEAYELTQGCVKPYDGGYLRDLLKRKLAKALPPEPEGLFLLKARTSYVFRLMEQIPRLSGTRIWGSATAKSSVGRMDVLARLIVDGMDEYEGFEPSRVEGGDMYLEITPMTFNVRVRPGTPLTQLRLYKEAPVESRVQSTAILDTVLDDNEPNRGATLSVDLSPDHISGHKVSAFSAEHDRELSRAIDLWGKGPEEPLANPCDHWKFARVDSQGRLRIRKERFYIIRSHEKIRLPAWLAVYCRASDETIGEMRIHYAGFVHPFFGNERSDGKRGTPLIFEVRGHDIDVSLRNREKMARLEFYRMSRDADSEPVKDAKEDPYRSQTLQLSKFFARWPTAADCADDGTVTPK